MARPSHESRQAAWVLLSELFVDAENTKKDLHAIGRSLQKTGFSVKEVETILRREVAPVCGRWMSYPGAIGPWPMFDEQELKEKIEKHLHKRWYKPPLFHTGLMLMPGVKREWEILRNAMRGKPDA
jgi:hypothetical protein